MISQIRERLAKATPGPWIEGDGFIRAVKGGLNENWDILEIVEEGPDAKPNTDFIAHAPEDIAFLLAEVERLTAENAAFDKRSDEYTKSAQSLIAELASAKADKERLDWLEGAKCAEYHEGPCAWRINCAPETERETLREAIDAAREAK